MAKIEKGNGVTFYIVTKTDLGKAADAYGVVENDQEFESYVEKAKIKEYKKWTQWKTEIDSEGIVLTPEFISEWEGYGD